MLLPMMIIIIIGYNGNHDGINQGRRCLHSKRKLHVPMTEKWKIMSEIIDDCDSNYDISNNDNESMNIQKEKTVLELAIDYSNGK